MVILLLAEQDDISRFRLSRWQVAFLRLVPREIVGDSKCDHLNGNATPTGVGGIVQRATASRESDDTPQT